MVDPEGPPTQCVPGKKHCFRGCPSGFTCGGSCGAECCGPPGSGSSSSSGGGGGRVSCPSGTYQCGQSHCTPSGGTCCAPVGHEEAYCTGGSACTANGGCADPYGGGSTSGSVGGGSSSGSTSGGSSGGSVSCPSTQDALVASCGGDTCGCADVCSSSSDCASGCCANGYCAPACVCGGQGTYSHCGGTTTTYVPSEDDSTPTTYGPTYTPSSCSLGVLDGGGSGVNVSIAAVGALVVAAGLRRRRAGRTDAARSVEKQ